MKTSIWCACMVAMLVLSTVAPGEIVFDDYEDHVEWGQGGVSGNSGYHNTSGYADGDYPWGGGIGEGWRSYYTTVEGTFEWWFYVKTVATADLFLSSNFKPGCYAWGGGDAYGECDIYWYSLSADAYVDWTDFEGDWHLHDEDDGGWPTGVFRTSTSEFDPDEGVYAEHYAFAHTGVIENSDELGFSTGDCYGLCDMYEQE